MSRRSGSYVNNSMNRSLGRVGMPYGSCVQSSSSSSSRSTSSYSGSLSSSYGGRSSSQRTYVDNPSNRRIGRVGKEVGTHVVHKDGSSTVSSGASASCGSSASSSKTYVDNHMNRSLGRVGKPVGTHVQHKDGSISTATTASGIYADNALNRKLERVGKQKGSHVLHKDGTVSIGTGRYYVDNAHNRKIGRVGKEIMKHYTALERKLVQKSTVDEIKGIFQKMDINDDDRPAVESALYTLQRSEVEEGWAKRQIAPSTDYSQVSKCIREIIPLDEITLQKQIGKGGFGEVYAGLWKETPIAFKKLLNQLITARKKKELVNEIQIFSQLSHPNIVKMFGVVAEEQSIGIVMEYLPKTLFYALFIEETKFDFHQKKKLIVQVVSATEYLHSRDIAHCDIKCQNILLDASNVAKLGDFGLSAMKNSTVTTSSTTATPGQGTPRYAAPEVLRGELLQLNELKMADIYSLSLVVYQVLVEEEPYEDLNIYQLHEMVGRGNLRPSFEGMNVTEPVKEFLSRGWVKEAGQRPSIAQFSTEWKAIDYVPEENL